MTKPKATVRLTKSRVEALQPGDTVLRVFDTVVPGFHVRVSLGGAKAYACSFQRPNGAKVHVTIGRAEVISVEDAREQARQLREVHDNGEDAHPRACSGNAGKQPDNQHHPDDSDDDGGIRRRAHIQRRHLRIQLFET